MKTGQGQISFPPAASLEIAELRQRLAASEEALRAILQAQEAERGRVALELHNNITQLLCAILFHNRALTDKLSARGGPTKREVVKLRAMLVKAAREVERISRNLRPSTLDLLGLVAVLRDTSTEFADRTGLSVKLACVQLSERLPAATELALYRILQEALDNVEKHARARHVTVCLMQQGAFVKLAINDDGNGFEPDHHQGRRKGNGGLGLLGMRERATYVGGALRVKSVRRAGTEIEVRIPLPLKAAAAN